MSEKNRVKIVEAAIKTLAENHLASMDDIACAAGVGRATLYRIFKSRKELMKALFSEADGKISEALTEINFEERGLVVLKKVVKALVPLGASFHFLNYEPLHLDGCEIEVLYRRFLSMLREIVEKLKKEGDIAGDIPTAWGASCLDILIWRMWTSVKEGDVAPNDAVNLLLRSYLNGLSGSMG